MDALFDDMATTELRTLLGVVKGRHAALRRRVAAAVIDANAALDRAEQIVGGIEDETKSMEAATADLQRELGGLSNAGPSLSAVSESSEGSSALVGVHPGLATVIRKG